MRFTHHIQTIKSSLVYRVVARMGFEFSRHSSWEPLCYDQGRNEVRWRPGQEVSLAHPCSKLSSFGNKCTVLQYLWHCWDFSAPPFRPSLRLWLRLTRPKEHRLLSKITMEFEITSRVPTWKQWHSFSIVHKM